MKIFLAILLSFFLSLILPWWLVIAVAVILSVILEFPLLFVIVSLLYLSFGAVYQPFLLLCIVLGYTVIELLSKRLSIDLSRF